MAEVGGPRFPAAVPPPPPPLPREPKYAAAVAPAPPELTIVKLSVTDGFGTACLIRLSNFFSCLFSRGNGDKDVAKDVIAKLADKSISDTIKMGCLRHLTTKQREYVNVELNELIQRSVPQDPQTPITPETRQLSLIYNLFFNRVQTTLPALYSFFTTDTDTEALRHTIRQFNSDLSLYTSAKLNPYEKDRFEQLLRSLPQAAQAPNSNPSS